MGRPDRTVVFVHGLWPHADSWTPCVERFGAAGYSHDLAAAVVAIDPAPISATSR